MNFSHMIIESVFGLALFINALLFIPQTLRIIKTKSAKDVSLITFAGFIGIQVFTILHGLINDDYLLAIGVLLSLLTCGSVVVVSVVYRYK